MGRLDTDKNVWVSSVRPDGRPHLVPIWFVYREDRFWLCTNSDSVKIHNLRHSPTVSLSLEDGNTPVVVEGTAEIHPPPYPDDVVVAFFDKFGWNITRRDAADGAYDALVEVNIDRWLMGGPAT